MVLSEEYPVYGPFFGVMGAAAAIIFSGELSAQKKKENGRNLQKFNFLLSFCCNFTLHSLKLTLVIFPPPQCSSWSRLWNRQVRNRNRSDECHETWTDYEIHHSRCHGWYYCHLRTGRRCPHRRRSRGTIEIPVVQVSSEFSPFFTNSFWVMWPQKKNQWSQPITFSLAHCTRIHSEVWVDMWVGWFSRMLKLWKG